MIKTTAKKPESYSFAKTSDKKSQPNMSNQKSRIYVSLHHFYPQKLPHPQRCTIRDVNWRIIGHALHRQATPATFWQISVLW